MKLSVAETLSEATKALRAEYTMGFVPTSSSRGSPVHTFAADAFRGGNLSLGAMYSICRRWEPKHTVVGGQGQYLK